MKFTQSHVGLWDRLLQPASPQAAKAQHGNQRHPQLQGQEDATGTSSDTAWMGRIYSTTKKWDG
jgi:hypothetical protein